MLQVGKVLHGGGGMRDIQAAPRDEQREIEKKLKEEQKRKIALLASQYENQIENMVQEKTVRILFLTH